MIANVEGKQGVEGKKEEFMLMSLECSEENMLFKETRKYVI